MKNLIQSVGISSVSKKQPNIFIISRKSGTMQSSSMVLRDRTRNERRTKRSMVKDPTTRTGLAALGSAPASNRTRTISEFGRDAAESKGVSCLCGSSPNDEREHSSGRNRRLRTLPCSLPLGLACTSKIRAQHRDARTRKHAGAECCEISVMWRSQQQNQYWRKKIKEER